MSNRRNPNKKSSKNESGDNKYSHNHSSSNTDHHESHGPNISSRRHLESNENSSKKSSDLSNSMSGRNMNNSDPMQGNSWRIGPRDTSNNDSMKKSYNSNSHNSKSIEKNTEDNDPQPGAHENQRQTFFNEIGFNNNPNDSWLSWHSHRFNAVVKNLKHHHENNYNSNISINHGPSFYDSHSQHPPKHSHRDNFAKMCDQAFSKLYHQRNSVSFEQQSQDLNGTSAVTLPAQPFSTNFTPSVSIETNHTFLAQSHPMSNVGSHEMPSYQNNNSQSKHMTVSSNFNNQADYPMPIQSTPGSSFPSPQFQGSNEAQTPFQPNYVSNPQHSNSNLTYLQQYPPNNSTQSSEIRHSSHNVSAPPNPVNYGTHSSHNISKPQSSNSHHYNSGRHFMENSSYRYKSTVPHASTSPRHSDGFFESQNEDTSRDAVLSPLPESTPVMNTHPMSRSYSSNPSKSIKNSHSSRV